MTGCTVTEAVRWDSIPSINQDVKICQIDSPLWKGEMQITATEECEAGSLEAAIRRRLYFMTTRGDPALRWYFNYPKHGYAVKNTANRELSYDIGLRERIKICAGETHALMKPTKYASEPSPDVCGAVVIRPDYEGLSPYKVIHESPKPPKRNGYARIANIGRY